MLSSFVFRVMRPLNRSCVRHFSVNVGDKVPVSFMSNVDDPVIKEDSEYPDWVLTLADPLPTKAQLLNK
jgi:hypothetical protein